jgi:hypothetical protein
MKNMSIFILLVLIPFISPKNFLSRVSLDSVFNIYKSGITNSHLYQEISNTTWKEYFVSENIQNIKKFIPYYINPDKELDLFVEDSSAQLYWINNIRGTSKDFTHKKLSKIFIGDFIVTNKYDNGNNNLEDMFILATNQNKNKIFKYKKNPHYNPLITNDTFHNTKNYWDETLFLSLEDESISSIIKINSYSKIKSLNIYTQKNGDYQILILNIEQVDTLACNIIQIRIKQERIISLDKIGKELNDIKIVGLFDMNNDGLIDILYFDSNNILYVYLNQVIYYYSIEIYKINPTFIDKSPRIFIIDANKDLYPDIITGDTEENTISILLNPGRNYWKKIINYYERKNADKNEIYTDIAWQYLPLIDTEKEKLSTEKLKDFTIIMIDKSKRISFEIISIFGNKIYWFIEKDNNKGHTLTNSIYQYLINSMVKCEIFIDKNNGNDMNDSYDIILDIDLNNDNYPEFVLYSYKQQKMIYMQRNEILLTQYGWSQAFWIYLMIGIYTMSSIIGGVEFYRIKNVNEKYHNSLMNNEEQKDSKQIELYDLNLNHYQYK